MADIKKDLTVAGQKWVVSQIDAAVEHNPRLSFISKRLKDGLSNIIADKVDMIDPYLPYITDSSGNLNVKSISGELLNAFDEMPMRNYNLMGLDMQVGKGRIAVMFPDNILTNLFLDNNKLIIGRADLEEFINVLEKS